MYQTGKILIRQCNHECVCISEFSCLHKFAFFTHCPWNICAQYGLPDQWWSAHGLVDSIGLLCWVCGLTLKCSACSINFFNPTDKEISAWLLPWARKSADKVGDCSVGELLLQIKPAILWEKQNSTHTKVFEFCKLGWKNDKITCLAHMATGGLSDDHHNSWVSCFLAQPAILAKWLAATLF